ncbi:MAG: hypothetical protein ACLTBV_30405 [Enterocloster bolteae]
MDEFQSMVEETKALVQKEIKNKDNVPDFILEKQLYLILEELDVNGANQRHPIYSILIARKGIADSWDYSNPLAIRLLELLESYRELQ